MELNPEGYTGYEGDEPHRIWNAVYEENCFPGIILTFVFDSTAR
jgi:hypothetical protein